MGTPPGLIDLGLFRYQAGPEPLPGPERRPARVRLRRWLPVVLATVLVWQLGGAAAAPALPLVPLWTAPDGLQGNRQMAVGDSDLYAVVDSPDGVVLTAYRLVDGSARWEIPLDLPSGSARDVGVALFGGALLVYSYDTSERTAVYDPGTARLRWIGDGYLEVLGAGLAALYASAGDQLETSVEIRELDSGAVLTSFEESTQRFAYQVSPDGPVHLVGLDRDGSLTSYDVATGAVLRRAATPHQEWLRASNQNGVSIIDNLVLVYDNARSELAAYDLNTLAPMWTIADGSAAEPCGPMVCVSTAAPDGRPTGLHGVDPATGTSRWSVGCTDFGVTGACALRTWELGPEGRMVVLPYALDQSQDEPARQVILDTATGRPVTAPTAWEVVTWQDSSLLLSRGDGVTSDGTEYWREEDITPHRVWWARSDPDLARIEVLGVVEADWCAAHDPYLVCYTGSEPFEVWRLS